MNKTSNLKMMKQIKKKILDDNTILNSFLKRKAKINAFIFSKLETNLSEISQETEIDIKIIKWCLNDLLKDSIIKKEKKEGIIIYSHRREH